MGYIALSCISEYAGSIELYKTNANKKETSYNICLDSIFYKKKLWIRYTSYFTYYK